MLEIIKEFMVACIKIIERMSKIKHKEENRYIWQKKV